ncbi:MAG: hypothetical protein Q7O66_07325 [Dehalococcoidia bacterium]|nr:hypothetical protein [Dehalococcoidia bacterium]
MIALHHVLCGHVAFYVTGQEALDSGARASDVVLLDGRKPDAGTAIVCGSCGQRITGQGLMTLPGPDRRE